MLLIQQEKLPGPDREGEEKAAFREKLEKYLNGARRALSDRRLLWGRVASRSQIQSLACHPPPLNRRTGTHLSLARSLAWPLESFYASHCRSFFSQSIPTFHHLPNNLVDSISSCLQHPYRISYRPICRSSGVFSSSCLTGVFLCPCHWDELVQSASIATFRVDISAPSSICGSFLLLVRHIIILHTFGAKLPGSRHHGVCFLAAQSSRYQC